MNHKGHPETLVPAHPGNRNAVKSGVHSPRVLAERAETYLDALRAALQPPPELEIILHEGARLAALIDLLDRALEDVGLIGRGGQPHYLLNVRLRASRQFERWHDKLLESSRKVAGPAARLEGERTDYVAALQQIALHDAHVSTRDRLRALKILLGQGRLGTASGALVDEERRAALSDYQRVTRRRFDRDRTAWVERQGEDAGS